MSWNIKRQWLPSCIQGSYILLSPKITHSLFTRNIQFIKITERDISLFAVEVAEANRLAAIFKFFHINTQFPY